MKKRLVIGITDHPLLGLIMSPYIVTIRPNHGFYPIEAKISRLNISRYIDFFTENEKKVLEAIEEYSDQSLHKLFSRKKKDTTVDFMKKLDRPFAEKYIRPYLEKKMAKAVDFLYDTNLQLFYKEKPKYINSEDRIEQYKPNAQAIFNITRLEHESHYYLTVKHQDEEIHLLNKPSQILVENPAHIIIENNLYRFEDINAKKLLPFFHKESIRIPKSSEEIWFKTFALDIVKNFNVKPSGFEIDETIDHKKAVFSFEKNLEGKPVFHLYFIYNQLFKFDAFKENRVSVKFEKQNEQYLFYKIARDDSWENQIIQKIKSMGLIHLNESYFSLPENVDTELSNQLFQTVRWLQQNKNQILKTGISLNQDRMDISYNFDPVCIETNLEEKSDWFDIYIRVQIGEFTLPFTKFRKNILNGNPEYKLPNGEIAILPREWFSKYQELFQFGKEDKGHLILKKHHFGLLDHHVPEKDLSIIEKYINLLREINHLHYKVPQPLEAALRPYQKTGYSWMQLLQEYHFGGCLADDMGLGKTIQTLTLLLKAKETKPKDQENYPEAAPELSQLSIFDEIKTQFTHSSSQTSLIVMPTSLIHNWAEEINKFTPSLSCFKYTGQNRPKELHIFREFDIILTTYGIVRNDLDLLVKFKFHYLILDESQYIKNPDSKIYKAVNQLNSCHRLVLTGTPIENSLTDLWAQLNFLNRGLLGNLRFFKREFILPIEKKSDVQKKEKLQQFIKPFILRRTKQQVAKDLPEKIESVIYCDMTEEQKSFYEKEKSKIRNSIIEHIETDEHKPVMLAIEGLTKLRQIANHPILTDPDYQKESGKFEEITRNIENLIAEKHKVLIFSAYVKHLQLIAHYLEKSQHSYSMLTGSTKNRDQVIKDFQNSPEKSVFLIQIKAGGVGLNLTAADYVFIIDPWWNPAVEEQAINRAHRIGQDKNVMVYRFISSDTVEEKIQRLKSKKSKLANTFVNTERAEQKMNLDLILEFLR
ncbi:MAG: DEAD/DEAH box helicase [Bacteroidales bacterium]|jgi:SNF2 family DNA or RNA helicase|nr:DEAD/DEAH box helicase [Bacteroidales bacterium]